MNTELTINQEKILKKIDEPENKSNTIQKIASELNIIDFEKIVSELKEKNLVTSYSENCFKLTDLGKTFVAKKNENDAFIDRDIQNSKNMEEANKIAKEALIKADVANNASKKANLISIIAIVLSIGTFIINILKTSA